MTEHPCPVLALTTEADQERAETLAEALLERRLVACVSLQPMRSLYHWQGGLVRESEVQLLMKTSSSRLEALKQAVMTLHSYDTPEWLSWSVDAAPAYRDWLMGELSSDASLPAPGAEPGSVRPAG